MHGVDHGRINQPVADIGLIRDNDHEQAGLFQFADGADGAGEQPEILQMARRVGFAVAHFATVNDAVPIKKNRAARCSVATLRLMTGE